MAFQNEQLKAKDKQGNLAYKEGDFKYEQRGGVHVFTFPDAKSAEEFIGRVFGPEMVDLIRTASVQEQRAAPTPHQHHQQDMRDTLSRMREGASGSTEGLNEPDKPSPLH